MKQVENKTAESKEEIFNISVKNETLVNFNGQLVPAADYHPVWIHNMADDVTLESSLLNGLVRGKEAVQSIGTCIKKTYDRQEFEFAGFYNGNIFLESYTGWFHDTSVRCLVMVARNDAGQAQNLAVSFRPLGALQLLSRMVGEHFAGTPLSEHFRR
jgi:hypothetical protein